jgi:hypothetical protein
MNYQYSTIRTDWMSFHLPEIFAGMFLFMILSVDLSVTLLTNHLPDLKKRTILAHTLRIMICLSPLLLDEEQLTLSVTIAYLILLISTYYLQKLKISFNIHSLTAVLVMAPMGYYQCKADGLRKEPEVHFQMVTLLMLTLIYVQGCGGK